jgi:hypothetical protein
LNDAKDKICLSFFLSEEIWAWAAFSLKTGSVFLVLAGLAWCRSLIATIVYAQLIADNPWLYDRFPNWRRYCPSPDAHDSGFLFELLRRYHADLFGRHRPVPGQIAAKADLARRIEDL